MSDVADQPPSIVAERLALEIKHAPTHVMAERGIERLKAKPVPPSPVQVALTEDARFLLTNLAWVAADVAFKIDVAVALGAPTEWAFRPSVFEALPEQTRLWLQGWQMQINTGDCWLSAGSIGRQAMALIRDGYLLCAKAPTKNWIGEVMLTRENVRAGLPGSPGFVEAVMGKPYLDWIAAI